MLARVVGTSRPRRRDRARARALRYDSAPDRRRTILSAVGEAGFVSVTELTRRLGVSDMTVRRDLRKLAHQGKVRIVHGGVSAAQRPRGTPRPSPAGPRSTPTASGRSAGPWRESLSLRATIAVDAGTTT